MEHFDRKNHWEKIYETRAPEELSWFQSKPEASLRFLEELNILKTAKIIDIGGGDSFERVTCIAVDHVTPSNVTQNFVFCGFRKR